MEYKKTWLVGNATVLMLTATAAGLISAQWNHEALPFMALGIILVLMVMKSRWIVMDFMGLRGYHPRLSAALLAWPAFFALAEAAKALLMSVG
jgi:nitric oxide reductase NorF protein